MSKLEEEDEIQFAEEETKAAPETAVEGPWKVLVVDDEEQVHAVTRLVLGDFEFQGRGLKFLNAYSAAAGASLLVENPDVAVILLDVVMESEHAGLQLVHRIREEIGNRFVRIVLRTGQPGQAPEKQAFLNYDINDYRTKTELTAEKLFTAMVGALRNYEDIRRIEKLFEQVKSSQLATVVAMADLAEYKDEDTGDHVLRIKRRTEAIARRLAESSPYAPLIDEHFLELVGTASILHDIGKIGIPDRILQKPSRLTEEEWQVMRTHATLGENLLKKLAGMAPGPSFMSIGANIAGAHHEKWDGSGYPRGAKGEEIPLEARIVAVADVYDALTSRRVYKEAWKPEDALAVLKKDAGSHFDPVVVEAFAALLEEGHDGTEPVRAPELSNLQKGGSGNEP
jgi:response regulator RpfG family c-di-GMP phosphodiesterase